jgi:nucleotide-binding universal stress UspA family protein
MERIVVGIDETPAAADAARFAVEEGALRGWPVTAVLCWTYPGRHGEGPLEPTPEGTRPPSPALDHLLEEALGARAGAIAEKVDEVDFAVAGLLHHVDPGDLLVLGPGARGLAHGLVRGSTTQRCLHDSPCPVAVVHQRPAGAHRPTRVVVGVDGSPTSQAALRWGLAEARARSVPAQVVHAWEIPIMARRSPLDPIDPAPHRRAARATLDQVVADAGPAADGVPVETILVEGPAADVLLDHSERGDLVVVGTRGIGGVAGILLGSTALRLSQLAPSPVVVVPEA